MKQLMLILVLLAQSGGALVAQQHALNTYQVLENPVRLQGALHNAYTLAVDADERMALESWAKLMDEKGAITYVVDSAQELYVTKDAVLSEISSQKLDVYVQARYDGVNDGAFLVFWFKQAGNSFMHTKGQPGRFHAMSKFLVDFGLQCKRDLEANIRQDNRQFARDRFPSTGNSGAKSKGLE